MSELIQNESFCYEWSNLLDQNGLILSFKGDFNQDLVNSIVFLTESRPEIQENKTKVRNRVFHIMVECMQNICKHGAFMEGTDELKPGIFLIGTRDDDYVIGVGNLVFQEEVDNLRNKIDMVRNLDDVALKQLHMEVLKTTQLSEKSGAGLGFISTARKSKSMVYSFRKLNDKISFFELEILIEKER